MRTRRIIIGVAVAMTLVVAAGCQSPFDFTGDGRADRVWVQRSTGKWFREGVTAPIFTQPVSGTLAEPVAGDYDGNRADDAAYVQGTNWVFKPSVNPLDTAVRGAPTNTTTVTITMPVPAKNGTGDALVPVPADYDGDGRTDPAWYRVSDATWFVKGQEPIQFGLGRSVADGWQDVPVPADYDGDKRADIATFRPGDATWRVRGRADVVQLGSMGNYPVPGNWNGQGKAEMAVYGYDRAAGLGPARWLVEGEAAPRIAPSDAGEIPVPADYNGDRRLEPGYLSSDTGTWMLGAPLPATPLQLGGNFAGVPALIPPAIVYNIVHLTFLDKCALSLQDPTPGDSCPATPMPTTCAVLTPSTLCESAVDFDFTGDGKADRVWVTQSTGAWHREGVAAPIATTPVDVMKVSGDYDGDGTWEPGYISLGDRSKWVTSGAAGTITVPVPPAAPPPSTPPPTNPNGFSPTPFIAVPADYDGDGTTDPAWFRSADSMWFIDGQPGVPFGVGSDVNGVWYDIPVPGDYDGDGDAEIATYRPGIGTFRVQGSAGVIDLGTEGNWPVVADYDGDGADDLAVFGFDRSAGIYNAPRWIIRQSSTSTIVTTAVPSPHSACCMPSPADYLGDRTADFSYVDDTTGLWSIDGSTSIQLNPANDTFANLPVQFVEPTLVNILRLTFMDKCAIDAVRYPEQPSTCPPFPA